MRINSIKSYNASDGYCIWASVIACTANILSSLILIIYLVVAEWLKGYVKTCTKRDRNAIA